MAHTQFAQPSGRVGALACCVIPFFLGVVLGLAGAAAAAADSAGTAAAILPAAATVAPPPAADTTIWGAGTEEEGDAVR
eukprot:677601-Prymnesium_polylepis.1